MKRFAVLLLLLLPFSSPTQGEEKKSGKGNDDVSVVVDNPGFLPAQIEWKFPNEDDKRLQSFVGKGNIPAGKEVLLIVRPLHRKDMYQWANWWVFTNDDALVRKNEGVNSIRVKAGAGYTIRVSVLQQSPNWAAATSRYRGVFHLVRVYTPDVLEPWKKEKSKGLAEDLAQTFVKERGKKGHWGKFLSHKGLSLYLPSERGDDVPAAFEKATVKDLTSVISELLDIIQYQRPPDGGQSISEQLNPTF